MNVYRIHIRPKGGLANPKYSFEYCLEENVLGLGWQTNSKISGITWEEYEKEATEIHHNDLSRVRYLKDNIKERDLIWTRDTESNYYLAKVISGWEYYTNCRAQNADITNIVRCNILKVPTIDYVPGKIIACFRPQKAIQPIKDPISVDYSKNLWNILKNTDEYQLSLEKHNNIYSFLSSEESENIIFIYLQTKGWIVVPHSRKADTMNYEFYLINRSTNEKAIVQVKTGNEPINPKQWINKKEKVFLFQSNGFYNGNSENNIICISPQEIENFMFKNQNILPSHIVTWLKYTEQKI